MSFAIDRDSETPIYQQIADAIRTQITDGTRKPGEKLPTVRTLFQETGIAEGTIRHAYGLLAREGTLVVAQGRGTFVREKPEKADSQEARAMGAIDALLDELFALGFSAREIRLFLTLKLDARNDEPPVLRAAFVDCNPESLSEALTQLSDLPGVSFDAYLLDDLKRSAPTLLGGYALLVTTNNHSHELCALLPDATAAIQRVAMAPSAPTVAAVAQIEAGSTVGIFCQSERFAQIVKGGLRLLPHLRALEIPVLLSDEVSQIEAFLEPLTALIVAPNYLTYLPGDALTAFVEGGGRVVPYHHQIDKGSLLYIEERVRELPAKPFA